MTDTTAPASNIAEVRSMDGLIKAFRSRVAQLNVSYETLDHVCGFATRYTSKIVSLDAHKHVGPMSFDALMAGLGVRLVMVEDPDALAKVRSRLIERDRMRAHRRCARTSHHQNLPTPHAEISQTGSDCAPADSAAEKKSARSPRQQGAQREG